MALTPSNEEKTLADGSVSQYDLPSSWVGDASATLQASKPVLQRSNATKGSRQPSHHDATLIHSGPVYENTRKLQLTVSNGDQQRSNGTGQRGAFQQSGKAETNAMAADAKVAVQTCGEMGRPRDCKQPTPLRKDMTLPPQGTARLAAEEAPQKLFKSFGERFVKEVRSRDNLAFTAKLHRHDVIPERIQNRVAEAHDNETANSILLEFLTYQSTSESLNALLVVMAEATDYPAMSKLGKDMKAALRRTTPVAGPGRRCAGTM